MDVQRYTMEMLFSTDTDMEYVHPGVDPEGEWVRFTDHEAALAAARAPLTSDGLEIVSGWLVERSEGCTCSPYGGSHQPECGLEPLLNLSSLRGWPDDAAVWNAALDAVERAVREDCDHVGEVIAAIAALRKPTRQPEGSEHEHTDDRCCGIHQHHVMPHRGCILR